MTRVILHIDLNQFFVTCARILDPSLNNKVLAIGSDGRSGIVSTCSYEARKYGIHSGMPMFYAKQLCKDLIIKEIDFDYVHLMSNEFMYHVSKLTPFYEQISCDECYCDITHYFKNNSNFDVISLLKEFQKKLYKDTKLQCSIGVAPTKFLAKMGSDYKKPMGLTIIRKKDIKNIIFPLKVDDFYGIGKKTAPILHDLNIHTIGDLYNKIINKELDESFISQDFQNSILNCLEGKSSDKLNDFTPKSKSIGTTSTLSFDTNDKSYLSHYLSVLIKQVVIKMIKEDYLTNSFSIVLKSAECNNGFKTTSFAYTFNDYTDNLELIMKEALKKFDNSYKSFEIRMIGFSVKNLKKKYNTVTQMTFDNYKDHEEESKTFLLINDINRKFNKEVVKRASDINKNGNK